MDENDLYFLYDIAHSIVSSKNMGVPFEEYISKLPLDRMIQVHICNSDVDETGLAYDAHKAPTDEELEILKTLLKYPNLKYFTVEYYKDIDILIESLEKVRKVIS